tara:strand:+ start:422 stop:997 length:576 start_codon:yes stop_codon:yes gene_type:complete
MFFSKKEKKNLGSFIRAVVGTLLKADPGDISVIDTENKLNENERKEIKNEIEFFRLIVLLFQLMEISRFGKKEFTPQELGQVFGVASGLAYQDSGLSKEAAEKKLNVLGERIGYYTDNVEKTEPKELEKRGVFFYLTKLFTDFILKSETAKFSDESFQEKHFLVFEMGKQIYRNDEKAFKDLIKNVKFIDE